MALSKDKFIEFKRKPDGVCLFASILPNRASRHFVFSVDRYGNSKFETSIKSTEFSDSMLNDIKEISLDSYYKVLKSRNKASKNKE